MNDKVVCGLHPSDQQQKNTYSLSTPLMPGPQGCDKFYGPIGLLKFRARATFLAVVRWLENQTYSNETVSPVAPETQFWCSERAAKKRPKHEITKTSGSSAKFSGTEAGGVEPGKVGRQTKEAERELSNTQKKAKVEIRNLDINIDFRFCDEFKPTWDFSDKNWTHAIRQILDFSDKNWTHDLRPCDDGFLIS